MIQKSKNPGSAKSCSPHQTSKDGCQTQNEPPIAKDDSPYKNFLGKIQRFSLKNDGEDDFASPMAVKTAPKALKTKKSVSKNPKTRTSKRKPTNTILKYTKDNFKDLDVNPEHLQMALALSKSTFAEENPGAKEETNEPDLPHFLSPQQVPRVTSFLEKYGFRSVKKQLHPDFVRDHLEDTKKRKNSKFRFVTPTLYTRTKEERESLINTKVSLLMSHPNLNCSKKNCSPNEIYSAELRKFSFGNNCWDINCAKDSDSFVSPSLQLSPHKSSVGCLLKSWDQILGREKSPARNPTGKPTNGDDPSISDEMKYFSQVSDSTNTSEVHEEILRDSTNKIEIRGDIYSDSTNSEVLEEIHSDSNNTGEALCDNNPETSDNTLGDCRTRHCSSPDLFESDNDSFTVNPEELHHVSDKSVSRPSSFRDNLTELIEKNENIECFESDFGISSRADGNSQRKSNSLVEIEYDDRGVECFESFYDYPEDFGEKDSERGVLVDLTQSSSEGEDNKYNDPLQKVSQEFEEMNHKGTEAPKMDATIENSEILNQTTKAGHLLTMQTSSVDSGHISLEYDNTKSLNVTDYVLAMLNSQDDSSNLENGNSGTFTQSHSTCSQESIVIESDEELNYSSRFSAQVCKENLYDLDYFDDCIETDCKEEDINVIHSDLKKKYNHEKETETINNEIKSSSPIPEQNTGPSTTENTKNVDITTPNNNLIIKTKHVTPMADYDTMDTPKIRKELDRFGIKPLKRRRGVELLKYIYESTHPLVNVGDSDNEDEVEEEKLTVKRRKLESTFENGEERTIKIVGTELVQNEKDDLLFERRFSKKIHSCRIPLQIAWYNFLCCNPALEENILLYEPIQLEVILSMLKEQSGCNFHKEELITFLDKKCITFRTNQWQKSRKKISKAKS